MHALSMTIKIVNGSKASLSSLALWPITCERLVMLQFVLSIRLLSAVQSKAE
jgi:hypothetical protein